MEVASRLTRAMPKVNRVCRQCRQASNLSDARYSTQTATAGLANDLLRSIKSDTAARNRELSKPSMPSASTRNTRRAPSMYDIADSNARGRTDDIDPTQPQYTGKELEQQMARKFVSGDVYSPHDLCSVEQIKWSFRKQAPRTKIDMVDQVGIDFMREYKNISLMQEFVTSNGRILPGSKTGLRPVNQRRMARAVRRASGIGLIPKTYKHPELLKRGAR